MKNNNVKKIVIGLVVIIAIVLIAVLGYFVMIKLEQNKIENTIEEMFSNLKSNENSSEKQEVLEEIRNNSEGKNTGENSIEYVILFEKLNYSIVKDEVSFKEANVVLDITNKNMQKILSNYLVKSFSLAMANAFSSTYSEEEMNEDLSNYLKEQVESDEIENITTNVTINMIKEDGKWIIKEDSRKELLNAILPGFVDTINQINNSLNESVE